MGGNKTIPFKRKNGCREAQESPEIIEADEITVEVVDKHTGGIFRRTLPVKYLENANGVLLKGETSSGDPVGISFFSADALKRLGHLFGKGPDTHDCDGHEEG
jgi:hypothetical protein